MGIMMLNVELLRSLSVHRLNDRPKLGNQPSYGFQYLLMLVFAA